MPRPGTTSLDPDILRAATELRHELHKMPEVAHEERETARMVRAFLQRFGVRPLHPQIGGHGLLFRTESDGQRPPILLRADLDALPIQEQTRSPYSSRHDGRHHACGHDGHMAMLAAAIAQLGREADSPGPVYALFQPAEETGEGAQRVLDDLGNRAPDFHRVFAIHNHPGIPRGTVGLRSGTAARPSMGLEITMMGRRTHASEPEHGRNPIPSLAALAQWIQPRPTPPKVRRTAFATIVGMNSGQNNYGVSPAAAALALTLRGDNQSGLDRLLARIERRVASEARRGGLRARVGHHDVFRETRNHPAAVREATAAIRRAGLRPKTQPRPLSASEDFGRFTERWPGALLLLGAGRDHAPLHAADYDFPDALIGDGARLWLALAGRV